MKRRAAQVTFAIGVMLGVVAGVAIVRGFGVTDVWRVTTGRNPAADAWFEHRAMLATSHSICAVIFGRTRGHVTNESIRVPIDRFNARHDTGSARPFTEPAQRHGPWWQRLGFQVVWWNTPLEPMAWGTMQGSERGLILPTWFVALLAALMTIFPTRSLRKERRLRQRRDAGQCLACGYDLRGAEHERCPECGADAVAQQVQLFVVKRRLMQLLFAIGLLLTLGISVLWVRSLRAIDSFSVRRTWVIENDTVVTEYAGFSARNGVFDAGWGRAESIPAVRVAPTPREAAPWTFGHSSRSSAPFPIDPTRPWWRRLGFFCDAKPSIGFLSVPAWFVVAPPLTVTCLILRRLLRDRRSDNWLARGMCLACGYDLRGAEHERCPECGHLVPSASHGEPSALSKMK